jgi:uncharacterized protein (TIGR03435 family)
MKSQRCQGSHYGFALIRQLKGFWCGRKSYSLLRIVNVLVNELGQPVVDKTNLKGLYDVRFEWAPENLQAAPENALPALPLPATAVQEQLGLKLESTRGPVEVIVVDGAQKPSEN